MTQKSDAYTTKRTGRGSARTTSRAGSRQDRRKRVQWRTYLLWGVVGLAALLVIGGLVWLLNQPAGGAAVSGGLMGDVVTVNSRDHIPEGTDPGPYSSDPPAGGHHYPSTYQPGFYSPQAVESLPKFYQGYLVHNLEHGYVIFWYNCQADPKINCDDLQNAVQQVIKENNYYKAIGFPWPSMKQPVAITSWGRIMRLDKVDINTMRAFYKSNVDKGPEQTPN